jgi:phage repressor protein C with HTH and peptisase S24 domain
MIKVTGESLSPLFQEGDYVLIATIPFVVNKIKSGDTIVFQNPSYGVLIKQVERVDREAGVITVVGLNPNSVDSRRFGPVRREDVIGKVIWHIARPAG